MLNYSIKTQKWINYKNGLQIARSSRNFEDWSQWLGLVPAGLEVTWRQGCIIPVTLVATVALKSTSTKVEKTASELTNTNGRIWGNSELPPYAEDYASGLTSPESTSRSTTSDAGGGKVSPTRLGSRPW